jgi:hypothetical protein
MYCYDTDGNEYAEFPCCFNYWSPHKPIANGIYYITNENDYAMEYGHDVGAAYGTFWVALDRDTGKGWHGYGAGRTLTSGTYGCIRSENEDGEQVCRAIEQSLDAGITVSAEVVGEVDEDEFCVGDDGEQ